MDATSHASGSEATSQAYTVRLEAFEGPLDLLLHLIKQEEIDIWNIPIARITEQYLEYMQMFRELNINLAGEFIVMASTLIYIKSRLLLPPDPSKTPEQLEEEDPRRELVYQLLEHQKFKNAAQMLYAKETVESNVWAHPPVEIREDEDDVTTVTLFDLVGSFQQVLKRLESNPTLQYEHEEYTIERTIAELRQLLLLRKSVRFSEFLERGLTRQNIVVIFLALLELARLREIRCVQEKAFGEILIRAARVRPADVEALSAGSEENLQG